MQTMRRDDFILRGRLHHSVEQASKLLVSVAFILRLIAFFLSGWYISSYFLFLRPIYAICVTNFIPWFSFFPQRLTILSKILRTYY